MNNYKLYARLTRAFEKRFGKSASKLQFRKQSWGVWRVFDPDSFKWVEFEIDGPKLYLTAEGDHLI